ncbi:hypothetical protein VTK73DRAFT_6943 [Phialemonium thermophilum]|uniref:Cell division control protein 73 C-terminal domain-containing protein n=1 Tax=Phialemonium thermophilum TaxID=223376 RepID=A0ABR3XTT0_9PEZI
MDPSEQDPLLLLRHSIASATPSAIVPTSSSDPSAPEVNLAQATHLRFTYPNPVSIPIDTQTRFISNGSPVDLRSIYFAWLNREVAIPEYNDAATKLNEELAGSATVHKFAFVERLDLITWLEGASEESEHIQPLSSERDAASAIGAAPGAATAAGGAIGAAAAASAVPVTSAGLKGLAVPASASARAGRGTLDPRLAQIYNGERRMADRNTVLRGIKPTDFSHVRKLAAPFMSKKPTSGTNGIVNNPVLALNQKPQRRPDPIILLSPSASSLLRLSNAKAFLEGGRYVPPDSSASSLSILHIQRTMRDIDPSRPMRFILVEGPEQFKPEYWNRVVAVFTTGQAWQFKNYQWSNPSDLFRHVLGIYIGWRGDQPPESIRAYGHRVMTCFVEKWREPGAPGAETGRWRDREVVENIWKAIENNMRIKGWKRDTAPLSI